MRFIAAVLLCLVFAASAQNPQPTPDDPVANQRAVKLAEQLRCLVCQNQSLAESSADLALDLRRQIREQVAQGKSDDEIVGFMVARYGDFVLYRPPLKATTLGLWFGPPMLLLIGVGALLYYLRRRRGRIAHKPLTEDEHRTARALLTADPEGGSE